MDYIFEVTEEEVNLKNTDAKMSDLICLAEKLVLNIYNNLEKANQDNSFFTEILIEHIIKYDERGIAKALLDDIEE